MQGNAKLRIPSGAKIGKLDVGLVDYEGRSGRWLREVIVTGHSNQSDASAIPNTQSFPNGNNGYSRHHVWKRVLHYHLRESL